MSRATQRTNPQAGRSCNGTQLILFMNGIHLWMIAGRSCGECLTLKCAILQGSKPKCRCLGLLKAISSARLMSYFLFPLWACCKRNLMDPNICLVPNFSWFIASVFTSEKKKKMNGFFFLLSINFIERTCSYAVRESSVFFIGKNQ